MATFKYAVYFLSKLSKRFKLNDVTINDVIIISHAACVLTMKMQFFAKKRLFSPRYS